MAEPTETEHVLPRVRVDGPVHLAEADPAWAEQYAREGARIRAALGPRALLVEHVGSTSVPGLAAKPLIDIVLAVAASGDEPAYLPDLELIGFRLKLREPGWHEHRVLTRDHPRVQVHVFTMGSAEIDRMLVFRDRLRRHPDERELYERTKRELAARHWTYVQDYADAKSAVIEEILASAKESHAQVRRAASRGA